ncbi:major facilitator superfamily domain-containing protein [Dactylonectria macrodidyma]|uniref:Major facilitator superfamily domain-containing protein n=1 Tax=Dactylonectria macrodidyma TaxID=307937 RepID=A0A9P9EZX0_9HYPO|nr:major facilitator superfamily domain-containing protein [Dactylonectria macrodidyma]
MHARNHVQPHTAGQPPHSPQAPEPRCTPCSIRSSKNHQASGHCQDSHAKTHAEAHRTSPCSSHICDCILSEENQDYFGQVERHLEVDSEISQRGEHGHAQRASPRTSSGRSQSLGSLLDYKRTTQWLKGLIHTPEAYCTKFTEIPTKKAPVKMPSDSAQRPSEPAESSSTTRRPTGKSELKIDGPSFKRAVSDLERLLKDALDFASHVVDYSKASKNVRCETTSATTDSDRHPVAGYRELLKRSLDDESPLSGHGSPRNFYDIDISEKTVPVRPVCGHASTFSGHADRPRLAEIIQNYSLGCEDLYTTTHTVSEMSSNRVMKVPHSKVINYQRFSKDGIDGKTLGKRLTGNSAIANSKLKKHVLLEDFPLKKRPVGPQASTASHDAINREALPGCDVAGRRMRPEHGISLRRRSHVSLRNVQGFNLPKSHKRQPIARDWSPNRKRYVATVACMSTALIGILLGIYSGLVPSIQYYIVDQSHIAIHGNTGCFLGLALPTFFLWPLPLLHGRKPYIMGSLTLAMPLLFPQALAVNSPRLNNVTSWRVMLIASRTLMGCSLGFASMNFHSILTDIFGASLMSSNPHQEVVDQFDARRHGGGMGVWLGIWTWCWIGSLGIGFLIGASIIDKHPPALGFYVSIALIAVVLLLNVVCPEARRSSFRRSVAEVRTGSDISCRLARGEVMMHRVKTGPKWWGNEVWHGVLLSVEMLRQPGFIVMAAYVSWIYAQVVLVIVLLGSLASRFYHLRSPYVGLHVAAMALGALLATPFQSASIFSRSRHSQVNASRETLDRTIAWSSHLIRRTIFTTTLPLGAACYAIVSSGPPMSIGAPTFFAMCIGFLSCLAVAKCNGVIMEAFDTSDLSPGMIGRQRDASGQILKKTNYSSFPRVTSAFAIIHTFAFILAAGSTALGGHITRTLGQRVASGVVAGILFLFTVLLFLVLVRFKNVLIIPRSKSAEMERLTQARRKSTQRRASMPNDLRAMMEEDVAWWPVMMGNPTGKNRRVNMLELGCMTRWQDIRRKNKLIDEGAHLNRSALNQGLEALDAALEDHMDDLRRVQGMFSMGSGKNKLSNRFRRSDQRSDHSSGQTPDFELDTLDFGPPASGPSHPRAFDELECFMGKTVQEENDGQPQAGPSSHRKD